jgi:hypothetical protein
MQNQNTKTVESWKTWQYLLDLIDIIQTYDLVYILKASQLGISWLLAILNLHVGLFNETAKCLLLSQGQTEAYDLLSKISFVHDNLPEFLKAPVDKDNRELFAFKHNRAEIRALPSTEKAGHGFQGSLVTRDEVARHQYARENFRAVARAVNSGGKLIELSTANKEDPTNYFQEKTQEYFFNSETVKQTLPSGIELYTNPSKPGSCLVFLGWRLRPVRDEGMNLEEWWHSRVETRFTQLEIEEQFPDKITDVFKASITRAYFDDPTLQDMSADGNAPIKQKEIETYNGMVRVYKLPQVGRRYILFTDPSDGVEDPFVTGVMDYVTGEVVCSATGKVKVDFAASIHDYLTRTYKGASEGAVNSYEYNAVGSAFGKYLNDLQTPNQAPRYKVDDRIDVGKKGYWVSSQGKGKHMAELSTAMVKRQFIIHDSEFIQQCKFVTRDNNGYPVTDQKLTFDWVMMMNGLWQLHKHMPPTVGSIKSYPYKRA